MTRRNRRRLLDEWFPTVARYGGFALLLYSGVIDRGKNPALIPAGVSMVFFKNVYGSGPPDKEP